ncbi:protein of unknown function [Saccharopolyspora shandongensis]|uniref:DUF397 domain-containing protein n=1 Tax=Saccharopolyspora shandongensis TaxID=418495 RepID=A0A1H3JSN3_9PSEU|nr:DUF397 domain-containing protein [Saccharopolyspora shandongensis]SDY42368.1 protein of unknown function [Saccharopolyspora shandongensis]
MSSYSWQKSSYTGPNGNCVELSRPRGLVRDSKDPNGPWLRVDVGSLIHAAKTGRFER